MTLSLDLDRLREAYRNGTARPTEIAQEVSRRIAARGEDGVWISLLPRERLLQAAAALERRGPEARETLPLYGVPFGVKDNIDVAGLPTTAACPGAARLAERSAFCVERLLRAGALLVGKTNLDQFATGLVGTRSPYGVARNPFDPAYIPGGSSSGSAVAVSAGLVSFALGTDTAGSGRVPAAFNNIVGLKPTRGLVSTQGVIPACASLDCVSVFGLTVGDTAEVFEVISGVDPGGPRSRPAPPGFAAIGSPPARFAFGVPRPAQLEFFGNDDAARLFAVAIRRLEALGGTAIEIDFGPFRDAAGLLYDGPWLAERAAAIDAAIGGHRDWLHPVTRRIIEGAQTLSAADPFRGQERLAAVAQRTRAVWQQIEVLLLPTAPTIFPIAEIEADPVGLNAALGYYTNFTNLLDLCALALPNGFQENGLPSGVTLLAPAFHDALLAGLGTAFQQATGLTLGATAVALPTVPRRPGETRFPYIPVAVFGAHLSGMPLNPELLALGARFRAATRTAPEYRLYALPDGRRPGLLRCPADGAAIELEVWDVPSAAVGALLATIAPPLGLGTVTLAGGSSIAGFLCEPYALKDAIDITSHGGWRAWCVARTE